jgi:hypothetical protein
MDSLERTRWKCLSILLAGRRLLSRERLYLLYGCAVEVLSALSREVLPCGITSKDESNVGTGSVGWILFWIR